MSTHPHFPLIHSLIQDRGITVKTSPSVSYPIPVSLFFGNNSDGTMSWLWPQGSTSPAFFENHHNSSNDWWKTGLQKILFTLGLVRFVAHGRLVVYADVPTATYIQHGWKK